MSKRIVGVFVATLLAASAPMQAQAQTGVGEILMSVASFFTSTGGATEVANISPVSILPKNREFQDFEWSCGEKLVTFGTFTYPGYIGMVNSVSGQISLRARFYPCGNNRKDHGLFIGQILPEIEGSVSTRWTVKGGVTIYRMPSTKAGVARARVVFTVSNVDAIPFIGTGTETKQYHFIIEGDGDVFQANPDSIN